VLRVDFVRYMFLLLGGVSFVVGLDSALDTRAFARGAAGADGTVVGLVRNVGSSSNAVAPVVRFQTRDGETIEFRSDTASSPPSYARGERVAVLYRPLMPQDARVADFATLWASALMFGGIGSIFFGIGAAWTVAAIKQAHRAADLKQRGKRLATTVQRIDMNAHLTVQGLHPYRIVTQWRDPFGGTVRTFESDYVWVDPTPYVDGRAVNVFVDPDDPSRYYVDLEFVELEARRARPSIESSEPEKRRAVRTG